MDLSSDNFFAIAATSGLIILLTIYIVVFSFLQQVRRQKHFLEKQNLQSQFQQELLRTQLEIQEQTFNNISQEIHDNIGQALSLVKLNLNTLNSPQTEKLEDTRHLMTKAISDLRDLSRSLHGEKIAEIGLQAAIGNELKIIRNSGRFYTQLNISGNTVSFPPQTEMILFRILQEALHNAIKHAKAKTITVDLDYTDDIFSLTITDDGIGFNQEQLQVIETGIGLKNMKNRAKLIQAGFSINSIMGKGTAITVKLPCADPLPIAE